ncbi:MAG: hypothetical protein ACI9TP_001376 [Candidatus Azotimanducaceae bacterium]|jgi:hypothetical protein
MLTIRQALYEEAGLYHGDVSTSVFEKTSLLGISRVD